MRPYRVRFLCRIEGEAGESATRQITNPDVNVPVLYVSDVGSDSLSVGREARVGHDAHLPDFG
jgi:hypothetical protein